jgi:hypothetical protein
MYYANFSKNNLKDIYYKIYRYIEKEIKNF